jgi:hypothetical protein
MVQNVAVDYHLKSCIFKKIPKMRKEEVEKWVAGSTYLSAIAG